MSANDKLAATFGPGRTTPTPTLETRIAEILSAHDFRIKEEVGAHVGVKTIVCNCGNRYGLGESHRAHQAAALAPVIAEAQADLVDALADLLDEIQNNAQIAEVAAPVPGESGRQSCIEAWDEILEEPADWLRKKAAEHRGHERDHLQELIEDAQRHALEDAADDLTEVVEGIQSSGSPNSLAWQTGALAMRDRLRARADKLLTE